MAGTSTSFPTSTVRAAIRNAMIMATPINPVDAVTFRWTPTLTTSAPKDPSGIPYDLTQNATVVDSHPDVQVPCAVRFTPGQIADTPLGEFDPSKMVVTVVDTDYALIQGADTIIYGTRTFTVDDVDPPLALFDFGVYEIRARAVTVGPHNVNAD